MISKHETVYPTNLSLGVMMKFSKVMGIVGLTIMLCHLAANASEEAVTENLFKQGTKWETGLNGCFDTNYIDCTYWIDGETSFNGKNYMVIYEQDANTEPKVIGYYRCEADKVYRLNESKTADLLIYDFGMQDQFEEIYDSMSGDQPLLVKCIDRTVETTLNDVKVEVMHLVVRLSDDIDYGDKEGFEGEWYTGIGNTTSPVLNFAFLLTGGGSLLYNVEYDGKEIIFHDKPANSLQDLNTDNSKSHILYNLLGTQHHYGDKGIVIKNGKKLIIR